MGTSMKATVLLFGLTVATSALGAEIYECTDEKGNLTYTNRTVPKGCKPITLPRASTATTKAEPKGLIPAEVLNAATQALVDPDESVRERAQQDLEKELGSIHRR
jgi:hypothetical protein